MGNKLDLNVDRKLRISLLALSAGSVTESVHKALCTCFVP